MNNNNTKKNTILDIVNNSNSSNIKKNNKILNITSLSDSTNSTNSSNSLSTSIENCKKLLAKNPMMAMFSVKNMYIGSVGLVLPWLVLLLIVGFIIII